ncbi:MAG: BNR-4 repeat-containing protein [Verrucomicrobiota bacterium]
MNQGNSLIVLRIAGALFFAFFCFSFAEDKSDSPLKSESHSSGGEGSIESALGFEEAGLWVTAPFEFLEGAKLDLKMSNRAMARLPWNVPPAEEADLAQGAVLSTKYVKEGKSSLEWGNHAKYPTISCRTINHDWKGFSGILVSIYSEVATGDVIEVGVQSDAATTYFLDYYRAEFTVDWVGWKEVSIPFSAFTAFGNPVGWQKVDAISFFAKSKWQTPDPRTVLYLDALKLLTAKDAVPATGTPSQDSSPSFFVIRDKFQSPVHLNHDLPEISQQLGEGEPEVQTCYYQSSRSRYGYYPKYDPGYVSFDLGGKVYLRSYDIINVLGADGKWKRIDLKKTLEEFAHQQGWLGISLGSPQEPVIRFDQEGDLYLIEGLRRLEGPGKEARILENKSVLLHSRDHGETWAVYPLPGQGADFEKLDGHNEEALKNPPVILLTEMKKGDSREISLLLPEKKKEGGLLIPPPILIAKNSLAGPVHSGGGNFIISQGEKIFCLYGLVPDKSLVIKNEGGAEEKINREEWMKQIPPIPENHPARLMAFFSNDGKKTYKAAEGIPTYIVSYDRKERKLSEPVFLGFGGKAIDEHNWGAITADSKGILHVVINGHIDPLYYVSSLKAGDITAWTQPIYVPCEPGSRELSYVSYASLNCDKDDNLLCVVRSDTKFYNHRLAVLRKPAGGGWEKEQDLVIPFNGSYHIWYHRVAYDRARNRFTIAFYDLSFMQNLSRDAYAFCLFIWPFGEEGLNRWVDEGKKGIPEEGGAPLYTPGSSEMTVLLSSDLGRSWKFATTADFATP